MGDDNDSSGTDDGHVLTFNTLLAAIDTAGMRDLFANSDPYFFFAPTDEAFAALPSDKRAALLNDPQALTTLIKTHFIPGYYPFGSLFSSSATPEIINVLGQKLRMTESVDIPTFAGPASLPGQACSSRAVSAALE